jgi:uncharacterized membrane protein
MPNQFVTADVASLGDHAGAPNSVPAILPKPFWLLVTLSSTAVGLISLRYALPKVPFPAPLPSFHSDRAALVVHATAASLALLIGPGQFLYASAQRRPALHRRIGRFYLALLMTAAAAALPVALHAAGGRTSSVGFLTLASAWLFTASMGLARIRQHLVAAHGQWMIRCFALTGAGVTLRILLFSSEAAHLPFAVAYPAIAWLCWMPNLLVTELWLRQISAPPVATKTSIGRA